MSKLNALLLTFFTLFYISVDAQTFYPPVNNYSSHEYGKKYNPENYCIVQDARGVMYFGNGNGVLEFDGTHWRYVQVKPGAFVRSLAIDKNGRIYAGTNGEFGYLKANKTGELKFVSLISKLKEEDLFFSDIWDIHTNDSKVYFQAQEVFFEYDIEDESIVAVYPTDMSSFHTSFMVDGIFHLRAREIGIVKYVDNDLERLKGTEIFRERGVFGVHKLKDDSLMIVTQELGLWKYADRGIRQLADNNIDSLTSIGIYGSRMLSDGKIALTTFTNGVQIINQKGTVVQKLDRRIGVRSNDVKYVYEDKDANLWMGLGNGISKVNYNSPLSYFNESSGIEGNVEAIIRYKNKIYVGTSYGLFVQDIHKTKNKEFENSNLLKDQVWDFEIAGDNLLIATSQGVFETNGSSFSKLSENRSNIIKYIPERKLFVSAGPTGIFVYSRSFGVLWQNENNYSTFLSAEIDPNHPQTIWLGTSNSGVYRLQYRPDGFVFDQYSSLDGLVDDELARPIKLDGEVKFGTTQGIISFIHEDEMVTGLPDSLKDDPLYYRGMFQADSLHDSSFVDKILLVEEDKNKTWICVEDKIGYYNHETKKWVNKPFWGVDYGRVNEFYLEDNGVLWIGCADGLIRYESNSRKEYETDFYTLVRSFSIGRDSLLYGGTFEKDGSTVLEQPSAYKFVLDYKYNDVKFTYSAPYFEDNHKPKFSYLLEGHDDIWSTWSQKTEVNFTNLNEGDYIFKVRAINIYGVISDENHFAFSIQPPWYRTTWAFILYGFALIALFFLGFRLFSARLKKKNLWLEGVVEERTREVSEKNEVLREQKQEIEDSINYAQRIQNAILPLEDEMKKWIPKSFVLFRPKDIVSGDFYWFTKMDNKLVIICADCTGHGVPGAFMSMIGSDRLNIIVEERNVTNPGLILAELSRAIKKSLKQDGEAASTKDGMDAAICTINLDTNEMLYSGANRPLWIVQNGEVSEIKATKVAVAGFTPDDQIFVEHKITLSPDLKFYMTSDGYADQFGGDRGKKLKVKKMKELLLEICDTEFEAQKAKLDKYLIDWMGDHEQIDDVCVVGFQMED